MIDFSGMAAVGDGKDDIVAGDHAEIAVSGLGRVEKKGRRTRAAEGGRYLSSDKAGFAHSREDDPSLGVQNHLNGLFKFRTDAIHKIQNGLGLYFKDLFYLFDYHTKPFL